MKAPQASSLFCYVAGFALLLSACQFPQQASGPLLREPVAIAFDGSERANVELDMAAGQLNVRGGSDKLLEGHFEYNRADYKPVVQSSRNGSHAVITIRQPSKHNFYGPQKNTWDLQLNSHTLLDLTLNCGAGEAQLKLGDVVLRSLEVHMGAGQVDLDLEGHPTRDYEVTIAGGVGQATIRLPKDVGIRADLQGSIGEINVSGGLQKLGDHYENNLLNRANVNVHVTVHGGIGEIRILG